MHGECGPSRVFNATIFLCNGGYGKLRKRQACQFVQISHPAARCSRKVRIRTPRANFPAGDLPGLSGRSAGRHLDKAPGSEAQMKPTEIQAK